MVTLKCGACGKFLEIPDEYQGQTGKCNGCGGPIAVPFVQRQTPMVVQAPRNRGIYILLGLFFGGLGVHNFYAGHTNRGIWQLVINLCTFWLIVPIIFIGAWVIFDLITITHDGDGVPFR